MKLWFYLRTRKEDKRRKEKGLNEGKGQKGKRLRSRGAKSRDRMRGKVAFPIENRGKPTSAHLEATIPI